MFKFISFTLLILLLVSIGFNVYFFQENNQANQVVPERNEVIKVSREEYENFLGYQKNSIIEDEYFSFLRNEIDGEIEFYPNPPQTIEYYKDNPDLPLKYEQLTYPITQVNVPYESKILHQIGLLVFLPYTVVDGVVFVQDYKVYTQCPENSKCVRGIVSSSNEPGDGLAQAPYNRNIIKINEDDVMLEDGLFEKIRERRKQGSFSKYPILFKNNELLVIDN